MSLLQDIRSRNEYLATNIAIMFFYDVAPDDQCQNLKNIAEKQGHNRFVGVVQYCVDRNLWYLTIDGKTCTELTRAYNVEPVCKN